MDIFLHSPNDALEIFSAWRAVYDVDADAGKSGIHLGYFACDLWAESV